MLDKLNNMIEYSGYRNNIIATIIILTVVIAVILFLKMIFKKDKE